MKNLSILLLSAFLFLLPLKFASAEKVHGIAMHGTPKYSNNFTHLDYVNPNAPIHLITGAAGCNESDGLCLNPILRSKGNWSAFRTGGIFHPYS